LNEIRNTNGRKRNYAQTDLNYVLRSIHHIHHHSSSFITIHPEQKIKNVSEKKNCTSIAPATQKQHPKRAATPLGFDLKPLVFCSLLFLNKTCFRPRLGLKQIKTKIFLSF